MSNACNLWFRTNPCLHSISILKVSCHICFKAVHEVYGWQHAWFACAPVTSRCQQIPWQLHPCFCQSVVLSPNGLHCQCCIPTSPLHARRRFLCRMLTAFDSVLSSCAESWSCHRDLNFQNNFQIEKLHSDHQCVLKSPSLHNFRRESLEDNTLDLFLSWKLFCRPGTPPLSQKILALLQYHYEWLAWVLPLHLQPLFRIATKH